MPTIPPNKQLQKFLLGLMNKPKLLDTLKSDPASALAKAALSATHKKVLLGGDAVKIKNLIGKAAGQLKFYPNIKMSGAIEKSFIHKTSSDFKQFSATPIHIIFGGGSSQVQLGLKPKVARKGKITKSNPVSMTAFAIHNTLSAEDSASS